MKNIVVTLTFCCLFGSLLKAMELRSGTQLPERHDYSSNKRVRRSSRLEKKRESKHQKLNKQQLYQAIKKNREKQVYSAKIKRMELGATTTAVNPYLQNYSINIKNNTIADCYIRNERTNEKMDLKARDSSTLTITPGNQSFKIKPYVIPISENNGKAIMPCVWISVNLHNAQWELITTQQFGTDTMKMSTIHSTFYDLNELVDPNTITAEISFIS